ncbi:MAG: imidazolonepropionase [Bacteroidetes bacterium]|jgi:imidazolonepropionase|nr:imidazolonepropionase [Bacteroidota bacterium]
MSKVLIKNIRQLVQVREKTETPVKGKEMADLPLIANAWLAIENGLIADYGSMNDFPGISDWSNLEIIEADGRLVLPSWVDSHTHIVYAGSREAEFADRIKGLTYEEIAQRGGGILNSAKKLQDSSEDELLESALIRCNEIISQGTGAVEIKSGYGLTMEAELKMLRVIRKLKEHTPLTIKATFLAAHAVPMEYKTQKEKYIDIILNETLPKVAEEQLAEFIDVFCEKNYFTPEETERILEAGKKHGLIPKVHAEQMSNYGGVLSGVKCGAISVDHLEYVERKEIEALLNSRTIPTILPGAAFFLSLPNPPAREMIDAGLPVAIASDFNPGSSPSGNMNFMQAISCIQYRMTPNECINATTINTAHAMNLADSVGSITIGKKANFFITKKMNSVDMIPYSFGSNPVETVFLNGKKISVKSA